MKQYVLADDLTGASDAGVQFAKRGARTVVWLDYGRPNELEMNADVVVIDTDSRAEPPATAYARLSTVVRALRVHRPRAMVKKMDSTLRGNAGPEVRALLDALPQAFAVICPAYPKNGRTSRNGTLYVHGTRVDETDFGRDLFTPVRDARIGAHLETPFAIFDLATVRAGPQSLSAAVAAARESGLRAAVVDAETDEDLRALAALDRQRDDLLWVGSAGVIEMLEHAVTTTPGELPTARGPVLFIVGSLSDMTQRQIATFARTAPATLLDPAELLNSGPGTGAAVAGVRAALARGEDALLALDGKRPAVEAALALGRTRGWDVRATSARLRRAFLEATHDLVRARPGATLVLSGGDIARSFCDAHAVRGMQLLAETAPGIPLSRAIGADLYLITKAGGFGRPETYRDILTALHPKVSA